MKKTQLHEQKLLDALQRGERLSVADVVDLLGVSEVTIRRLFARLEQQGKLIRTYGGVLPMGGYLYEKMERDSMDEKTRIGECAAQQVGSGGIYIDSGTTAAQMCRALAARIQSGHAADVTVFTNSLVNLELLGGVCKVHLVGGEYRPGRRDVCGYIAEAAVAAMCFSQCFLGADGFNAESLFMATDFETARLCEIVLGRSRERYILADTKKFGRTSLVSYCGGEMGGVTVITDGYPETAAEEIEKRGLRVCTAKTPT